MQNIQFQRGPGAEPLVGVREAKPPPPETGVWGPEAEQVLMIIKTFWLKFCS